MKITIEARYFVCYDGKIVGSAMDQFDPGDLKNPFPFRKQPNRFEEEWEADGYAAMMRAHVAEVAALPPEKKRDRSAAHWTEPT